MPHGRPVLLVHGAWHGPWCWNEWVPGLAARGHRPMAVTLPGHGTPGTRHRLWYRLGDYINEVASQLAFLGPETVVVGHSMGGLVAQRALERVPAARAVLLAPIPAGGVLGASLRTARRTPIPFLRTVSRLSMLELVDGPGLIRDAFFTPGIGGLEGAAVVEWCARQLQNESFLAYLEMFVVRARPDRVRSPVRVVAGELDSLFTVAEEQALARRYGTTADVVAGAGHDLMLGPWSAGALDLVCRLVEEA